MLPTRFSARAVLAALTVTTAGLVWVGPAQAGATWCAETVGVTTYLWDGGAGTDQWVHDQNWVGDHAPGFQDADGPVQVCLAAGDDVVLVHNDNAPRGEAVVEVLDLAAGARLEVATSGRLYLEGDPDTRTSRVRRSGTSAGVLTLSGLLGGVGTLRVDGLLDWVKTVNGGTTMTTRACQVTRTCVDGPPTAPGRVEVGAAGRLVVRGGGVGLIDGREIRSVGRVQVDNASYVAMDNGTLLDVADGPSSVLALRGSGSVYQGFADLPDRARVVLAGRVLKTGAGTSLLDADVEVVPASSSRIDRGWLSLGAAETPASRVRPGSTVGLGACAGSYDLCAAPEATAEDPGAVSVRLPDTEGPRADVSLVELPGAQTAADLVPPVAIHVDGHTATARQPMRFTFLVDGSALDGRPVSDLDVYRKPTDRRQRLVPDCRGDGRPPSGWSACVSARTTTDDGDARVVVSSQVNSRWKIR